MTLWIEKYKQDLINHIYDLSEQLDGPNGKKNLSHIRYYQSICPEFFNGLDLCTFYKIPLKDSVSIDYYMSWDDYKSQKKSIIHNMYIGRYILFDDIHKVYMNAEHIGKLELKDENGNFNKYFSNINYLKEQKESQDLFYDKMNQTYKNYEFDYPAFSNTYKGSPRFWKNPKKEEVFGIELELKFKSYDAKIGFAEMIKKTMKPWICEKDGSLDNGDPYGPSLELIGPPLPFEDLKCSVNEISVLLDQFNCCKPSNTYALHITTNINNANNPILAGARFMAVINNPRYRNFWTKAAGRPDSYNPDTGKSYAQWLIYKDSNINSLMDPVFWNSRWAKKPIDHYYSTFLRKGGNSIETRIFKSAKTPSLINNRISLIAYLWRFAKSKESIDSWIEYISSQSKPLTSYLKKNSMISIDF